MILIDKPYVSEFLIKTIKENNFQIISTSVAREMIPDESLNWITEEEAKKVFESNPNTLLITNSENSISWIENNLGSTELPNQIRTFKNKIEFRKLLSASFPNYFFKAVEFHQLRNLIIEKIKFPFIIKPSVGFFSIAVHKVDKPNEWNNILKKIENEIENLQGLYPKEVIGITEFIIEEYIEGKEYAVDCYFDENGDPVILNILHHKFSSANDVSDRVYSTSEEIMNEYKSEIQNCLTTIGEKTNLKNFPAHIEIRIDEKGNLNPIEVNPLRYGGWCTTGDLSWYSYGFNSYEYFLTGKKPNWEEIFRTRKNKKYSIIVLDNNSGIEANDIEYFDYDKLLNDFEKPMSLRKVDFKKYGVFGFLFTETSNGNEMELDNILTSNLKKYIVLNK